MGYIDVIFDQIHTGLDGLYAEGVLSRKGLDPMLDACRRQDARTLSKLLNHELSDGWAIDRLSRGLCEREVARLSLKIHAVRVLFAAAENLMLLNATSTAQALVYQVEDLVNDESRGLPDDAAIPLITTSTCLTISDADAALGQLCAVCEPCRVGNGTGLRFRPPYDMMPYPFQERMHVLVSLLDRLPNKIRRMDRPAFEMPKQDDGRARFFPQ